MPGTIGRGRPRPVVIIARFQQYHVLPVAETNRPPTVGKPVRERSQDVRQAVGAGHGGGVRGHHEAGHPLEDDIAREHVVDFAGDAVAAQVVRHGFGVAKLDELQAIRRHACGRVVHDLGQGQRSPAAARAKLAGLDAAVEGDRSGAGTADEHRADQHQDTHQPFAAPNHRYAGSSTITSTPWNGPCCGRPVGRCSAPSKSRKRRCWQGEDGPEDRPTSQPMPSPQQEHRIA